MACFGAVTPSHVMTPLQDVTQFQEVQSVGWMVEEDSQWNRQLDS